MHWIWIALGGGLGSVLRFWLQGRVQGMFAGPFPAGTLAVNLIGSLLIGFLGGVFGAAPAGAQAQWRFFLMVGVLGGFTTFSAFSLENLNLLREGQGRLALAYLAASNGLGLALAFAGFALSRLVSRHP